MFVLEKFLYIFDLEVGAFVIGMFGFTTSFLLELFIVMLLYQSECLGLFKLYTCATIVAYYMFASFMLVKEIFCDRKPSIVKHFLVIDIIVTCTVISGNIKFFYIYPSWWPLFLLDSLFRLYSELCIYSLLIKYINNCRNEKSQQSQATDKSTPSVTASSSSSAVPEGVMKIFDNFCGYYPLEMSGYIYCGLNFVCSVIALVLLLVFGDFDEEDVVIFVIIFIANAVMLLVLFAAIRMKKPSVIVPFLVFTFSEIFIAIYLLISSMIVIIKGEEYDHRMQRFIEKINIPETIAIGIWIYFYLCICSLYDAMKCDENEKKMLVTRESITYGSMDKKKRSSNL